MIQLHLRRQVDWLWRSCPLACSIPVFGTFRLLLWGHIGDGVYDSDPVRPASLNLQIQECCKQETVGQLRRTIQATEMRIKSALAQNYGVTSKAGDFSFVPEVGFSLSFFLPVCFTGGGTLRCVKFPERLSHAPPICATIFHAQSRTTRYKHMVSSIVHF